MIEENKPRIEETSQGSRKQAHDRGKQADDREKQANDLGKQANDRGNKPTLVYIEAVVRGNKSRRVGRGLVPTIVGHGWPLLPVLDPTSRGLVATSPYRAPVECSPHGTPYIYILHKKQSDRNRY